MKSKALTPQQQRVMDFILKYQREHGRRPTYEQIGAALGMRSAGYSWPSRHKSSKEKRAHAHICRSGDVYRCKCTG